MASGEEKITGAGVRLFSLGRPPRGTGWRENSSAESDSRGTDGHCTKGREIPLEKEEEPKGFVYFLMSRDRMRCKLGYSINPYARYKAIHSYYKDFEFVGCVPGTPYTEVQFATEFRKSSDPLPSAGGGRSFDWFRLTPEIASIIEELYLISLKEVKTLATASHGILRWAGPRPRKQAVGRAPAGRPRKKNAV